MLYRYFDYIWVEFGFGFMAVRFSHVPGGLTKPQLPNLMTKSQAFQEITSQHKWYVGHYSQGYASQLVSRFKAGQLKTKTINKILHDFGYRLESPEVWGKTKD